ncbi:hemolysin family protein [Sphingomicrobium clamense]|uniref:Hemolysin family protein n=1 Tax=Sphingomicrobium clamense TaxID=2851013 RepID=A0ABS6V3Q5_9SPHN|nr:hemolysin family protein [Sphingomicrobium sp. B8]MBW0144174.1 hemolysin family protein [Sphingomicrobium sp. B8]
MSDPLTPIPWIDVFLILLLVMMNGLLSMSELAIVSAREARLKAMAQDGSKGATVALDLAAQPGRFLSTVQIGITLIGILAGAYSGASLGGPVSERFAALGVEPDLAQSLGFGTVIVLTTYASLVIGELVPKQFALRSPEPIAAFVARPMYFLSRVTAPLVWLLDKTSALVFRLLGVKRESENHVTAEELHMVVAEAQTAGVLEESERAIISGVVRLADRPVREIMTPRTEIDWIDVKSSAPLVRSALESSPHSRLPIADGSVDEIVGVVRARDILTTLLDGKSLDLASLAKPAPIIPDLMDAMDALAVLRAADVPLALVHDEYGHLDGIVTPGSILVALAGHFISDEDSEEPLVERKDGSYLVAGSAKVDVLTDKLRIRLDEDERDYSTVAGFALSVLKRLPAEGERFEVDNWKFEVVDMDGRKIDKLIARRKKKKKPAPSPDGNAD